MEVMDGYMVVRLANGPSTVVMMDKRAAGTYRVGDTVTLDSALRPLGRS